MDSLGVYIQVPFCASKCSFCNFSSRVAGPKALRDYLQALLGEIDRLPVLYHSHPIREDLLDLTVNTIYMGGGTPSLLGIEQVEEIVRSLERRFRMAEEIEFTLEVTPGSAQFQFLARARSLGVNRLSLGAQSFDDRELHAAGRLHSGRDTCTLVESARRSGYKNVSLDLIAGLPHQTTASWRASLEAALTLEPEHVSVYLFEIDENSRLGAEVIRHGNRYHAASVPDDDFMAEAYETACAELTKEGYAHYEISNFALPGFESQHNRKYWRLQPYIGLGAGAHSFDGAHRWANLTQHEEYRQKIAEGVSPIAEWSHLDRVGQLEEFFFLGLREREGISLRTAREHWGDREVLRWEPKISELVRDGWLEREADRLRVAPRALLVSNEIFREFLA